MAFVDERTLVLKAGDGGSGVVRFRHEKFREFGGPAGGNGGKGGDVYAVAVGDVFCLSNYQERERFSAGNGEDGRSRSEYGKNGSDIELRVPVGSIIECVETGVVVELLSEGERVQLLKGGRGGRGNEQFKSSINQAPTHAELGKRGEAGTFRITLKLIADAGLVGLPNAGKSSLLNALTDAHAKVGAYAFTTLEPNLGAFGTYILADIPGLIEGAARGRGLGTRFLKHVTRTAVLIHCIACEEEVVSSYEIVRGELSAFDPALMRIPEYCVITKADTLSTEEVLSRQKLLSQHINKPVDVVSVLDDELLGAFAERLRAFLAHHPHSATMVR